MKTTVLNIYGAPGSGKSTLAAELFAEMKKQGYSVELVREEIKTWAHSGHTPTVFEQVYITNKQMLEETSLYGKVEYLITDSPISLGDFYCQYYHENEMLNNLHQNVFYAAKMRNLVETPINIYLWISPGNYQASGRYSTYDEAKKLTRSIFQHTTGVWGEDIMRLSCEPKDRLISVMEYIKLKNKENNQKEKS